LTPAGLSIRKPRAASGSAASPSGSEWLTEQTEVDPYTGRIVDLRFAGYMVPVNPDVPKLDVSFAEDVAPVINPLGARGIGELPMAA
jgi:CO/xanthine dehydrogenase Mo-binding subunit